MYPKYQLSKTQGDGRSKQLLETFISDGLGPLIREDGYLNANGCLNLFLVSIQQAFCKVMTTSNYIINTVRKSVSSQSCSCNTTTRLHYFNGHHIHQISIPLRTNGMRWNGLTNKWSVF